MSESVPDRSAWERVATILRRSVPRQQFETWFRGMALVSLTPDRAELTVPNNFLREWILRKYFGVLRRALREVSGGDPEVEIRIGEDDGSAPEPSATAPAAPARPPSPRPSPPLAYGESDVTLNAQYTFDNFIPGPSNNFPYAAALAVADSPGKSYNPLFLHGSVGLGKTHLLQAICHRLMERRPDMRILYLSCETFTNHFVTAVANGELDSFRFRYRHVDVLLIDDIHFLASRERTQEEFFHTFNTLYTSQKQIVLSSDSSPRNIPSIEERLRSRFEWGLIADIQPPDLETKVAILRKKADIDDIDLPDDVALFVANQVKTNVRELEGLLTRVAAFASLTGRPLSLELARETLRDILPEGGRRPSAAEIIKFVARHYGLKVGEIKSKSNSKQIAFPRQVAMYLCKQLTDLSYPEIGRQFNDKHHSTVMYSVEKIDNLRSSDVELARTLDSMTRHLS